VTWTKVRQISSSQPLPWRRLQWEQAVAFAYAQLSKPYQWGRDRTWKLRLLQAGTGGLGSGQGRDPAGHLTSSGPPCRTSSRPPSSLGDLLCYDGIGHGAIYVGGGYIIHAPQTGMDMQKSR
jgi:hypothetical protein